jgi:ABC-2 type transport system ATP-binding protein
VFLDEPTAGVDPISRRQFWSLIRELAHNGTTVFVTTHYMDEAEYCARIGLMVAGKLVAIDSPRALKTTWVPGRVIALREQELKQIRTLLAQTPGVLAIEPFGASVHVRFDETAIAFEQLEGLLKAGMDNKALVIEPAEVSLEDVFLAVVAEGANP